MFFPSSMAFMFYTSFRQAFCRVTKCMNEKCDGHHFATASATLTQACHGVVDTCLTGLLCALGDFFFTWTLVSSLISRWTPSRPTVQILNDCSFTQHVLNVHQSCCSAVFNHYVAGATCNVYVHQQSITTVSPLWNTNALKYKCHILTVTQQNTCRLQAV